MNLEQTCKAIKELKIQGAENITTAALLAIKNILKKTKKKKPRSSFMGIRPCKNKAIQYALNRTRNAQLSERIFFLCRKRRDKNKTPAKNRPTFERTKSEQRKNSFLWN